MSAPIAYLTLFTKDHGPLTKHISLERDGTLASDKSACTMASGKAIRYPLASFKKLAELINGLRSDQAIGLGSLRADLPDEVEITTKNQLNGRRSDLIARTAQEIVFEAERPALALFDYDAKGMPPKIAARLEAVGGFWSALKEVMPALKDAAHLLRCSTSAGLINTDTGEEIPGSNGLHGYVLAQDGADIPRFLQTLHDRCWLAGYGWMLVGVSGQLLDRSIIDRTVAAPERLVFEGPPIVEEPLKQDRKKRQPVVHDGGLLDTVRACKPLTLVEQETLKKLKAEAKQSLQAECNKVRDAYIADTAKRRQLDPLDARKIIESVQHGILLPSAELEFDNSELNNFTVADILDDPGGFEGVTLADPIEGIAYGRCKAKVLRRGDGTPWIHSFAHGRTTYQLKYDASAVRARLADPRRDAVQLLLAAHLDPVEEKELVHEIAGHLRVGVRAIEAKLKALRSEVKKNAAREIRERRLAERTDPRPQLDAPPPDAPWLPTVEAIDEVLSGAYAPPPRNARAVVIQARQRPILGMHAFTANTVNPEEETSNE